MTNTDFLIDAAQSLVAALSKALLKEKSTLQNFHANYQDHINSLSKILSDIAQTSSTNLTLSNRLDSPLARVSKELSSVTLFPRVTETSAPLLINPTPCPMSFLPMIATFKLQQMAILMHQRHLSRMRFHLTKILHLIAIQHVSDYLRSSQ